MLPVSLVLLNAARADIFASLPVDASIASVAILASYPRANGDRATALLTAKRGHKTLNTFLHRTAYNQECDLLGRLLAHIHHSECFHNIGTCVFASAKTGPYLYHIYVAVFRAKQKYSFHTVFKRSVNEILI